MGAEPSASEWGTDTPLPHRLPEHLCAKKRINFDSAASMGSQHEILMQRANRLAEADGAKQRKHVSFSDGHALTRDSHDSRAGAGNGALQMQANQAMEVEMAELKRKLAEQQEQLDR